MEDKDFIIEDSTLLGRNTLIKCVNKSIIDLVVPEGVSAIDEAAFEGYSSIKSVLIPNSVTFIGDDAFRECTSLVTITIPSSVLSLGNTPFYQCESLSSILVEDGNKKYASIDGVLYNKELSVLLCCPPKKEGHFKVLDSVIELGDYAVDRCSIITSITLPEGIEEIPDGAFKRCSSIKEFIIPNSVTSIGMEAFAYCSSLKSIVIPSSVEFIDEYAFDSCEALESIIFKGTIEEWNSIEKAFEWDVDSSISIIHCTDGDVEI